MPLSFAAKLGHKKGSENQSIFRAFPHFASRLRYTLRDSNPGPTD